jgi:hypothetical protein
MRLFLHSRVDSLPARAVIRWIYRHVNYRDAIWSTSTFRRRFFGRLLKVQTMEAWIRPPVFPPPLRLFTFLLISCRSRLTQNGASKSWLYKYFATLLLLVKSIDRLLNAHIHVQFIRSWGVSTCLLMFLYVKFIRRIQDETMGKRKSYSRICRQILASTLN